MSEVESGRMYDSIEGMNPKQKLVYDDAINWLGNISPRIYALVERFDYAKLGMKTTVCTVILKTGYEITNYSVPVLQEDFNTELGQILAKKRVIESLLELDRYNTSMLVYNSRHSVKKEETIITHGHTYETITEGEI